MTKQEAIEILNKNAPKSDPRLCALELCSAIHVVTLALQEKERKKGHWVNLTCTECGQFDFTKPDYCPSCGADMRGDEE